MKITLIDKNTNGIKTIIDALSICRDVQCTEETLNHCLTAKPVPHLSALEFCWFCFLIEGVSVKARIQQLRHRHFSTMERSTRAIDLSDSVPVIPPTTLLGDLYLYCYRQSIDNYVDIIDGQTREDASYVLPLGIETKFVLAGNGRVWYEYFQKRLCKKYVQAEHYRLADELYIQLVGEIPQFMYAHPCQYCGQCAKGQ